MVVDNSVLRLTGDIRVAPVVLSCGEFHGSQAAMLHSPGPFRKAWVGFGRTGVRSLFVSGSR